MVAHGRINWMFEGGAWNARRAARILILHLRRIWESRVSTSAGRPKRARNAH